MQYPGAGYPYPIATPNEPHIAVSIVKTVCMFDTLKINMKGLVY